MRYRVGCLVMHILPDPFVDMAGQRKISGAHDYDGNRIVNEGPCILVQDRTATEALREIGLQGVRGPDLYLQ